MIEDGYLIEDTIITKGFNKSCVPNYAQKFFQHIRYSKERQFSASTKCKTNSIYSDLYVYMTDKKTPKHIALAQSVHHLFRSKNFITELNRLGHCISYTVMKNIDHDIVKSLLSENEILPSNIIKNSTLFVHGGGDNNDFQEETLSGKGTTHVTASVLYQQADPSDNTRVLKPKPTKDTLSIDSKIYEYQKIKHFNPSTDKPVSDSYMPIELNKQQPLIDFNNMFWVLCRTQYDKSNTNYCRPIKNFIPGWSPFINYFVHVK